MKQKFKTRRAILSVVLRIIIVASLITALGVVGGVENGARIESLLFLLPIGLAVGVATRLWLVTESVRRKRQ